MIIRFIDNRKDEITRIVKHTDFVKNYISRLNTREMSDLYNNDPNMMLLNMTEENASSMDWMLFNYIAVDKWSSFTVLGMGFSNGEIFQKGVFLVGIIFIVQNFIR